MKLKYFSHYSFQITTDSGKILHIDPFLDDNLTPPVSSDDISADYIILTHGHGDHIGDTGLFYDMKLTGKINTIDYMLLPIRDNFTMGIDDAVKAVELTRPKTVTPIHYNTFSVIEADPAEFANKVAAK